MIGLLSMPTGAAAQSNSGLVIQVLEANQGENLTEKELPPLKVRVMDRTGRVIPGADVLFQAPDEGPTGHFVSNNASQINVTTDSRGMAIAPPFRTNTRVGDYQIQIVASFRDSVSRAMIPQSNVYKVKSSNKKFIIMSAVIGGAAAAALASKRGGGATSSALDALAVTPTLTVGSSVGVTPTANPVSLPASNPALTITVMDPVAPAAAPTTTTTTTPTTSTPPSTTTSPVVATPAPAPTPTVVSPPTTTPTPSLIPSCKGNKKNCR